MLCCILKKINFSPACFCNKVLFAIAHEKFEEKYECSISDNYVTISILVKVLKIMSCATSSVIHTLIIASDHLSIIQIVI